VICLFCIGCSGSDEKKEFMVEYMAAMYVLILYSLQSCNSRRQTSAKGRAFFGSCLFLLKL
jgi:hypothetical protein